MSKYYALQSPYSAGLSHIYIVPDGRYSQYISLSPSGLHPANLIDRRLLFTIVHSNVQVSALPFIGSLSCLSWSYTMPEDRPSALRLRLINRLDSTGELHSTT